MVEDPSDSLKINWKETEKYDYKDIAEHKCLLKNK